MYRNKRRPSGAAFATSESISDAICSATGCTLVRNINWITEKRLANELILGETACSEKDRTRSGHCARRIRGPRNFRPRHAHRRSRRRYLRHRPAPGNVVITDFTDFTDGDDVVDLSAFSTIAGFSDLTITAGADGVTIDLTAHRGGTILLQPCPARGTGPAPRPSRPARLAPALRSGLGRRLVLLVRSSGPAHPGPLAGLGFPPLQRAGPRPR